MSAFFNLYGVPEPINSADDSKSEKQHVNFHPDWFYNLKNEFKEIGYAIPDCIHNFLIWRKNKKNTFRINFIFKS